MSILDDRSLTLHLHDSHSYGILVHDTVRDGIGALWQAEVECRHGNTREKPAVANMT
jgi:hypothetical protein